MRRSQWDRIMYDTYLLLVNTFFDLQKVYDRNNVINHLRSTT